MKTPSNENIDFDILRASYDENKKWANLEVTIHEIGKANKSLIQNLSKFDLLSTISLLSGLLMVPKLQSHCLRIEVLINLSMVYCKGSKKCNISQVINWFSEIGNSRISYAEDPAEDVFVSLIIGEETDYRLPVGAWESAGFYTQRFIDVVNTMPESGNFEQLKKSTKALLEVSDLICQKSGLSRYDIGSDEKFQAISSGMIPGGKTLSSRVTISMSELDRYNISIEDLEPFILDQKLKKEIKNQVVGDSYLDRFPFIKGKDSNLVSILPSSISVALRGFVIEQIQTMGLGEEFDKVLAGSYAELFSKTPILGGSLNSPVQWIHENDYKWAHYFQKIDAGYFLSIHLFNIPISKYPQGGFKELFHDDGTLTSIIQRSIDGALKYFDNQEEFKEGIILLVGCGWGKGYTTDTLEIDHPKWRLVNISAPDLISLSWLGDMSPSYFWSIQDGHGTIREHGVKIYNPNGLLNLIGWVRRNDGHFVPHSELPEGKITKEKPLFINPPINLNRDIRAESVLKLDKHCSIDNDGRLHVIQRSSPTSYFQSESLGRTYASITDLNTGTLTCVYEGDFKLWGSILAPNISDKNVEYHLWQLITEWLHRIGREFEDRYSNKDNFPLVNVKLNIEFRDRGPGSEDRAKPTVEELESLVTITPDNEQNAMNIIFESGFLDGFRLVNNIAERLIVRGLISGYLKLLGMASSNFEIEEIEKLVVPNDNARSFHLFHGRSFLDYISDSLPKELITVEEVYHARKKIGLGHRIKGFENQTQIEKKEKALKFLHGITDVLIKDIKKTLKKYDLNSTLKRLILNCEKSDAEDTHWRRTGAAVLGLHGINSNTESIFVSQLSKFAGTAITSRVLIEMALCECSGSSDSKLSNIELRELLAATSILIQYGGVSDAIYYNILPPALTISPLGDILFYDELGNKVVQPMLSDVISNKFISEAPRFKKMYDKPEVTESTQDIIDPEFWRIWNEEMGFNIDSARSIIDALETEALNEGVPILQIKRSKFIDIVCSEKIDLKSAESFLNMFTLTKRSKWDKIPNGYHLKEIYPWRYGRKLSFVTRPILQINKEEDPELLVAPNALRNGFMYVFDSAYHGKFNEDYFSTDRMKRDWINKVKEGHTFTSDVSKQLSSTGWEVRENIGLPEILNQKLDKDYGDVDVLAWRKDRNEILAIECKDLSMARNYSEVAAQLSDYQGKELKGKPDKLKKHLNRVGLLSKELVKLQKYTGLSNIVIKSCLIFSGKVPMQYAKIDALNNTLVGDIEFLLSL